MAPTAATKEPACPQRRILTLNNANGQKLHIVDPDVFTVQELVWLQLRHNNKDPSDKLEVIRQVTHAPKDPRTTAALDGLLRRMCEWKLRNLKFETPEFLNEDFRQVADELRKHKEIWEPGQKVREKEG